MRTTPALTFVALVALILTGCSSGADAPEHTSHAARVVSKATPEQQAKLFDRIKSLEGEWISVDDNGTVDHDSRTTFNVSSAGSVVREFMAIGKPYEMTNVYHMDGPNLVVTHYCAGGNQPRMVATPADAQGDRIRFHFDSVTNLTKADTEYMGELTLVFLPDGKIRQEWNSLKAGKMSSHAAFTLMRRM